MDALFCAKEKVNPSLKKNFNVEFLQQAPTTKIKGVKTLCTNTL